MLHRDGAHIYRAHEGVGLGAQGGGGGGHGREVKVMGEWKSWHYCRIDLRLPENAMRGGGRRFGVGGDGERGRRWRVALVRHCVRATVMAR